MIQLKQHFLLSTLCLLMLEAFTFGQTSYESPHVKDGKTIQFEIPEGYFLVGGINMKEAQIFTRKENLNIEDVREAGSALPFLAVLHLSAEENSMESLLKTLQDRVKTEVNGKIEIEEPNIIEINGKEILFMGTKGEINGKNMDAAYVSVIAFGDYYIMLTYVAEKGVENLMNFNDFKAIISNGKEVVTEKEDQLAIPEKQYNDRYQSKYEDELYEYEDELYVDGDDSYYVSPPPPPVMAPVSPETRVKGHYQNDLFETTITFYDVIPGRAANWYVPKMRNSHLLFELVYLEDKGFFKVFSGGSVSNYPSTVEMGKAIQLAITIPDQLDITYDSQFSNEDHTFRAYTISNGGTITSIYTTVVNDELVFFVVDEGSDPVPGLQALALDLLLDMMIKSSEN